MPTVHVTDTTSAPAEQVLAATHDFSARRAQLFPDVHVEHLTVHHIGEHHADVTEGNPMPVLGLVWERLHYDWSHPGTVKGTVVDSNLFKAGSSWELRARAAQGHTVVEVIAIRRLRGKGRLLAPIFPLGLAQRMVAEQLRHLRSQVEEQQPAT